MKDDIKAILIIIAIFIGGGFFGAMINQTSNQNEINQLKNDRSFLEHLLGSVGTSATIESCENTSKIAGCKFSGNVLINKGSTICICEESVKTKTIQDALDTAKPVD